MLGLHGSTSKLPAVAVAVAAIGCVDVTLPDDLGDGTTTSTTATTDDEAVSDSSETSSAPDLPLDDSTATTDDSSTDSTGAGDAVCCTCGEDFECWEWGSMSAESCEIDQSNAVGLPTHWCLLDAEGMPSDCLAACQ